VQEQNTLHRPVGAPHPHALLATAAHANPVGPAAILKMSGERRPFHALVWPGQGRVQERVDIVASSHEEAAHLLRETYNVDCEFDLTDVEAAKRRR
jgi:hypothetical protein